MTEQKRIIAIKEREYATTVSEFKIAILKALKELNEANRDDIFNLVISKFLVLKDPYDYSYFSNRNGIPTHMVATSRHAWALVYLQKERKILKTRSNPNTYRLIHTA